MDGKSISIGFVEGLKAMSQDKRDYRTILQSKGAFQLSKSSNELN